jgi:hypothetical protein
MTGLFVPFDVLIQKGPPKPIQKPISDDEYPFVSQIVVHLFQQVEPLVLRNDQLVPALWVTTPKLIVE